MRNLVLFLLIVTTSGYAQECNIIQDDKAYASLAQGFRDMQYEYGPNDKGWICEDYTRPLQLRFKRGSTILYSYQWVCSIGGNQVLNEWFPNAESFRNKFPISFIEGENITLFLTRDGVGTNLSSRDILIHRTPLYRVTLTQVNKEWTNSSATTPESAQVFQVTGSYPSGATISFSKISGDDYIFSNIATGATVSVNGTMFFMAGGVIGSGSIAIHGRPLNMGKLGTISSGQYSVTMNCP